MERLEADYSKEYINIMIKEMLQFNRKQRPKINEIYEYLQKKYVYELFEMDDIMDVEMYNGE
jgi:hypothetical protein